MREIGPILDTLHCTARTGTDTHRGRFPMRVNRATAPMTYDLSSPPAVNALTADKEPRGECTPRTHGHTASLLRGVVVRGVVARQNRRR